MYGDGKSATPHPQGVSEPPVGRRRGLAVRDGVSEGGEIFHHTRGGCAGGAGAGAEDSRLAARGEPGRREKRDRKF
jgi:hypothetical protein